MIKYKYSLKKYYYYTLIKKLERLYENKNSYSIKRKNK